MCELSYLRGSSEMLVANPAARHHFVAWSEGCSGRGDCLLAMSGATSVTAMFSKFRGLTVGHGTLRRFAMATSYTDAS
jgi:hypothetical protein